ncbi:hypothetical protein [Streptomyces sp. NPDC058701]|uniref:hypothetical protein n=1 Tax=Streptomyces sp. NPDC058701 TaxID=3346608 RepID=UPI00364B125C
MDVTTMHDTHLDVAAYVLGIIDEPDVESFEEHLLECTRCAAEVEQLGPTAQRLAALATPVDGRGDAPTSTRKGENGTSGTPTVLGTLKADDELLTRTLAAVALRRRGERRVRMMFSLAASAAVIAGTGAVVVSSADESSAPRAAHAVTQPPGQVRTASNATTGVTAVASLRSKAWGTAVSLSLKGVEGPQRCRLIATDHQGGEHPMGDWKVPAPGYGVPGHPAPLVLETSTDLDPALIHTLVVRTTDGRDLATIAV